MNFTLLKVRLKRGEGAKKRENHIGSAYSPGHLTVEQPAGDPQGRGDC